jgi:hypothetical protein
MEKELLGGGGMPQHVSGHKILIITPFQQQQKGKNDEHNQEERELHFKYFNDHFEQVCLALFPC